jgi:DNA-binding transcriptional LysR family regulator
VKPRQLEVLHAIMTSASLTAAAQALGTTQPAVSATLAQLEAELGMRLFQRAGRRLVPTQEAELLFPEVERLFLRLQSVRRTVKAMREGAFDFLAVIATPTLAESVVPEAFRALRARRPGIRLRLETALPRQAADAVGRREYDLGLIHGPDPGMGTSAEPLGVTHVACALRAGHRLAALPSIPPAALSGEAIVTVPRGGPIREAAEAAFRAAGQELAPVAEMATSATACLLAQSGAAVAVVDPLALAARGFPDLVQRRLEGAAPIELNLLHPRDRARSRPVEEMVTELRRAFAVIMAGWEAGR